MSKIIAIDGPAASGKSTLGHLLAHKLHFQFIDSGSIYRAVTYYLLKHDIGFDNLEEATGRLHHVPFEFKRSGDDVLAYIDHEHVTNELHSAEVTKNVSVFSAYESIRAVVKIKQKQIGDASDTVMTGRDTGTVIYPDAEVKFFIWADAEIRADRRVNQLQKAGKPAEYEEILRSLIERDRQDMTREVSPLKKADDAIEINTGTMGVHECVGAMYSICNDRLSL